MIFDIRNYGAIGDGKKVSTVAIQKAIDECASAGGGRVLVSGGTYLTGSICLKENVDLHLDTDGILLASDNCEDFPERIGLKHVETDMLPRARNASVIFAEECSNISITGNGVIDCNGSKYVEEKDDFKVIENSIKINIDNVIVEYVDKIESSNGKIYTSSLVLCSSDYGISLIIPMEITPKNILNQM